MMVKIKIQEKINPNCKNAEGITNRCNFLNTCLNFYVLFMAFAHRLSDLLTPVISICGRKLQTQ